MATFRTKSTRKPVRTVTKRVTSPNKDLLADVGSQFSFLVEGLVSTPQTIVMTGFAIMLIGSYILNPSENVMTAIIARIKSIDSLTKVAEWLTKRIPETIGTFSFVAVYMALNREKATFLAFVAVAVIVIFKGTVYEYVLIATSLYVFFKVNSKNVRMLMVAIIIIAFYFGAFDTFGQNHKTVVASPRANRVYRSTHESTMSTVDTSTITGVSNETAATAADYVASN